ncbi:DUF3164 family protein [Shewanella oneidensis MR-1]|uniref:Sulfate transporter n=1 Tax=Shewanella oneidensis (strain ATCC 700550 / JCM 31522 / CIP 106686 / LMG 19005 / NCIMB 14063 / MR-1) TaxID=211586 RepID=Q8EDT3_SHEON|nr:DUF3164 family protein [Shewanella oneidensis]AAN55688.1 Mu phage protein of unknown function DUF3164 [Shewanella oneidensis MR-1]MDX5995671.1 DUF3164 family protein [Shewanella oneidensis]MEE2026278.1 hypothetical protein [Shewanella oneidensis]QKG97162.1 DUF3164 family protein [Shewanella oneidensis MR-1]
MNTTNQTAPQGFRLNALGHAVPESQIKEIDKLRDELVLQIVTAAKEMQGHMATYKATSMRAVADFIDLSASEFGVKFGGTKGNVSLVSFDGKYKVQRSIGEHRVFDERIQAAKSKIDDCIKRWSVGSNDHIKALVELSFKVNKQGYIDINQVLSLRQLDIDDTDWRSAMDAIADSIQVMGSTPYLRVYERQDDGTYKQISLDIAKL